MIPWEHTYVAWAIDRSIAHGYGPGQAMRDRIARFHLALFTSEAEGYPRAYATPGQLAVGLLDGPYFTTWREVFDATFGSPPSPPLKPTGYYGPEGRLMLMIAKDMGWARAQEAYDYLMAYVGSDGIRMTTDLNERSGWAVDDRRPLPPSPPVNLRILRD